MHTFLYVLRLRSGRLYVGITCDLLARLLAHCHDRDPQTTSGKNPPARLLLVERYPDIHRARRREEQLKGWSHYKKEALVRTDFDSLRASARCRSRPSGAPGGGEDVGGGPGCPSART